MHDLDQCHYKPLEVDLRWNQPPVMGNALLSKASSESVILENRNHFLLGWAWRQKTTFLKTAGQAVIHLPFIFSPHIVYPFRHSVLFSAFHVSNICFFACPFTSLINSSLPSLAIVDHQSIGQLQKKRIARCCKNAFLLMWGFAVWKLVNVGTRTWSYWIIVKNSSS